MSADHITQLILEYRYWILIPLTFLEGPIVAFIAGTLASAGYFNVYLLGVIFFVRDVVVDLGCYYLGFFGAQSQWVHRVLRKLGITQEDLDEVRTLWHRHPGKTMFFSKLSYGVAAGFIVVAGLVEMPIEKFLMYGSAIALMHYVTLLAVGYFFGAALGSSMAGFIENIPYAIGGIALFYIAYRLFQRHMNKRLKKEEESASRR